jgi:hypothetical protein
MRGELDAADQPRPGPAGHRRRPGDTAARHRGHPGHHRAQRLRHRHRPGRRRLPGQAQGRPPQTATRSGPTSRCPGRPASNPPSASCSASPPASARPQNTADRGPRPARWLASGLAASSPRAPGHVLQRSHEQQAPNGSDQVRSLPGPSWSGCCPWPRRGRVPRSACPWTSAAPGMAATTSRPTCPAWILTASRSPSSTAPCRSGPDATPHHGDSEQVIVAERAQGSFTRQLSLGEGVDPENPRRRCPASDHPRLAPDPGPPGRDHPCARRQPHPLGEHIRAG